MYQVQSSCARPTQIQNPPQDPVSFPGCTWCAPANLRSQFEASRIVLKAYNMHDGHDWLVRASWATESRMHWIPGGGAGRTMHIRASVGHGDVSDFLSGAYLRLDFAISPDGPHVGCLNVPRSLACAPHADSAIPSQPICSSARIRLLALLLAIP